MKTKRQNWSKNAIMHDDFYDDIVTPKTKREKKKNRSLYHDHFDEQILRKRFKKPSKRHVFDDDEY